MKKELVFFLVILLLFSLAACNNSQYIDSAKQYKELYLEVAKLVDLKDTKGTLDRFKFESNLNKIEKMGELLESMKGNVPSKKELQYQLFVEAYQEIKRLKDTTYKEYLDLEKKNLKDFMIVDSAFIRVKIDEDNIKDW